MPYTPEELERLDFGKRIKELNKRNYLNEVRRLAFQWKTISDDDADEDDHNIEIDNNFTDNEGKLVFFQDPDSFDVIENIELEGFQVGEKQKKLTVHYRDKPTLESYEADETTLKESFKELPDLKDSWV